MQGGAAVLSLQGPLKIEPIVAQGCRPLTQDSIWLVEKSENNIIMQVHSPSHKLLHHMHTYTKHVAESCTACDSTTSSGNKLKMETFMHVGKLLKVAGANVVCSTFASLIQTLHATWYAALSEDGSRTCSSVGSFTVVKAWEL